MSDQGPASPPGEGSEDKQSHLRIIPPDPVPDEGGEPDAPAPEPPSSTPPSRPRVRVFSDDDPASMPLPAMGPGSGGSRLPGDEDDAEVPAADDDGTATATQTMETPLGPGDGEAAADDPEEPAETGSEPAGSEPAGSEPAAAEDKPEGLEGRPESEAESAPVGVEPEAAPFDTLGPDVDTSEADPFVPAADPVGSDVAEGAPPTAAGVAGVRLDRSDTGEIIKVSADQIPRDPDAGGLPAAAVAPDPAASSVPAVSAPAAQRGPERRPSPAVKVATGIAFGVVALIIILLGRSAFAALAGILIVWGIIEFYGALYQYVAEDEQASSRGGSAVSELTRRPAAVLGVVAVAGMVVTTFFFGIEATGAVAVAALVAVLLWFVPDTKVSTPPRDATLSALGLVHIGIAGCFAMLILRLEHGFALLLVVVVLTIVSDVAAYAWGANIGHTPFFQSVSPNKSLEGFLGGVATTIVAGLVVTGIHGWLYPSVPVAGSWGQMFALAILVAVAATAGDLSESLFKRELGIKDVASILPGHGGMLDRLDGMLFALPVAYVFLVATGLADVG